MTWSNRSNPWNVPKGSWEPIQLDFVGSFDNRFWFVGINTYSKSVEIEIMDRITTVALIWTSNDSDMGLI